MIKIIFFQIYTTERRENRSLTNNCDLIREYLARTRAPPPMFCPTTSFMAYNQMPPHRLLVDIAYKHPQLLVDDAGDADNDALDGDATNKMSYNQYQNRADTSAEQLPNECRLIGNVNPALIKTWKQLNGYRSEDNILPMANYPKHHGHDGRHVAAGTAPNKNFIIRRAAVASGNFYDSIDNESFIMPEDEEQLIASICEEMVDGGEALAEYISMIE